ncbi:MAG: hypothetical protein ACRDPA_09920 [Solirubrobacteraceae bacterium]
MGLGLRRRVKQLISPVQRVTRSATQRFDPWRLYQASDRPRPRFDTTRTVAHPDPWYCTSCRAPNEPSRIRCRHCHQLAPDLEATR